MRAAIVFKKGELPRYVDDFPKPVADSAQELVMTVKAVAVKHLDKMRASGQHYSTNNAPWEPRVPGGDGVGILEDGTRVYALGVTGTIAENAIIDKHRMVVIPSGVDDSTACAIPNGVMGSALALLFRAKIVPGNIVLINGATGFTGKIAVQLAKHYGAKYVIATGRSEQSLQSLGTLGADEIISLKQDDESILQSVRRVHKATPIDIVIDYVWGRSAEAILNALKGDGGFSHRVRYVTVGAMAGDKIELSSSVLRSTDIQISGSGLGSWSRDEVQSLIRDILPEMFQLAADNKLKIETVDCDLENIASIWDMNVSDGKRLVIKI